MTSRFVRPLPGDRGQASGDGRLGASPSTKQTLADKFREQSSPSDSRSPLSQLASARPLLLAGGRGHDIAPLGDHAAGPAVDRDPLPQNSGRNSSAARWQPPSSSQSTGWLARQLRAGLLGLFLGLVGVIPAVFWLTGRLDDPLRLLQMSTPVSKMEQRGQDERSTASAEMPPILLDPPKPIARPVAPTLIEKDSSEAVEEMLNRARSLIDDGEIVQARELLSNPLLADNPKAAFALAETFDPNILAAMGARGVRAEVERARMLYGKALANGIEAAKKRLDALH
jgi:hypothetical protein